MASHGPNRVPKATISRYSHIWDYPGVERCAMRIERAARRHSKGGSACRRARLIKNPPSDHDETIKTYSIYV